MAKALLGLPLEPWAMFHVAMALLIDPLDREPSVHVFHDMHVPRLTLGDALPTMGSLQQTQ